ncbi:MAG TPA: hypothetical protein PLE04_08585, partial [Syntrophales bacterium]|nr:hypothetical protein [Syntrophales bacterium]
MSKTPRKSKLFSGIVNFFPVKINGKPGTLSEKPGTLPVFFQRKMREVSQIFGIDSVSGPAGPAVPPG